MSNDTLDAILDIKPEDLMPVNGQNDALTVVTASSSVPAVVVEADIPQVEKELEDDFQKARKNITDMIKNVSAALDSAIMLAQAGDQPRAYEVVGNMLEKLVNANQQLVELHGTKKETLQKPEQNRSLLPTDGGTVNIDKAVFVGRASDLLREIKQLAKKTSDGTDPKS